MIERQRLNNTVSGVSYNFWEAIFILSFIFRGEYQELKNMTERLGWNPIQLYNKSYRNL
jgi:hypothetical protein